MALMANFFIQLIVSSRTSLVKLMVTPQLGDRDITIGNFVLMLSLDNSGTRENDYDYINDGCDIQQQQQQHNDITDAGLRPLCPHLSTSKFKFPFPVCGLYCQIYILYLTSAYPTYS
jgi:hypothetical protein